MKHVMEYPLNRDEVSLAKNILKLIKEHELYMLRKRDNLQCIPETVALEDR
jgi:hypothetical protein